MPDKDVQQPVTRAEPEGDKELFIVTGSGRLQAARTRRLGRPTFPSPQFKVESSAHHRVVFRAEKTSDSEVTQKLCGHSSLFLKIRFHLFRRKQQTVDVLSGGQAAQ